jgi:glycosyltransferase involved in cell wall biosynthesis
MKIALLIKRFVTTGGAERYAMEVARRLALQHDVHVFAQEWSYEGKEKITFHKIPRFLMKPSWLNQLLFSHFSRKTVDSSFDILHSHEKVTKFDVMTIHSPCFRSFITQHKSPYKRLAVQSLALFSPRKLAWLWLEKRQFAHRQGRLFIAVSKNVQNNVQANYVLPAGCFHIAYPGVNASIVTDMDARKRWKSLRSKFRLSEEELIILFVGTEFKRKGLDALLHGFALIPHSKVKLLVAGGGGDKMNKYKNLAENLGLGNHVVFLGLVKDVEELYTLSDVFILPTLSDPSPMAPIEAMTFGLPTVMSCSEYSGAAEHIKSGEALILNNPRDPNEIAGALRKVMDADFRAQLGRKGQALAAGLTWEATAANTLSVYEEVLRKKSTMHRG